MGKVGDILHALTGTYWVVYLESGKAGSLAAIDWLGKDKNSEL